MSVTREGEKSVVKCTAKGNNQPPKITWKIKNEPEFQCMLKKKNTNFNMKNYL